MKKYEIDNLGNLSITNEIERLNEAGDETIIEMAKISINAGSLMSHLPLFIADIPMDILMKVQAVIKAQNA